MNKSTPPNGSRVTESHLNGPWDTFSKLLLSMGMP